MAVLVLLPNALRPYGGGNDRIPVDAQTAGEAIQKVVDRYPLLKGRLPEDSSNGNAIFRNGKSVDKLQGMDTPLAPNDRLTLIVPEGDL